MIQIILEWKMEINATVWMEHMIMVFRYAQSVILLAKHAKIIFNVWVVVPYNSDNWVVSSVFVFKGIMRQALPYAAYVINHV